MSAEKKSDRMTIQIKPELRERIDRVNAEFPYKATITSVVERGIRLAISEMETIIARSKREA